MADIFNKLHHVCVVVHDIDRTQAAYERMGIGPWQAYPPLTEYQELQVPDAAGFMKMQYRVCNLPNIQLQLCQPGPEPTPQRIFLDSKGEGVFHMGFEVPDCDAAEAEARAESIPVLMRGRRPNRTGFTYFDTADQAGVVLLVRATPPAVE